MATQLAPLRLPNGNLYGEKEFIEDDSNNEEEAQGPVLPMRIRPPSFFESSDINKMNRPGSSAVSVLRANRNADRIGSAAWMPRRAGPVPYIPGHDHHGSSVSFHHTMAMSTPQISNTRKKQTIPTDPSIRAAKTISAVAERHVKNVESNVDWHLKEVSKKIQTLQERQQTSIPQLHETSMIAHLPAFRSTLGKSAFEAMKQHAFIWDKYDTKRGELFKGRSQWLGNAEDPNSPFYGRVQR